ncbi:uncharacterized protein LOC132255710 [Phlebotomus argentipes]|uniref:uncharacterized protein LOC132255710 n=1 Tax=Phlebotomus argentipes TaxID=94469 RepID=UPI00289358B5|nr:uncharacterized protein LOC132255710 [Phlebotomus argentipes]
MLLDVWQRRATVARRGVRFIVDAMTRKRRPTRASKPPKEANYVKETFYDTLIDGVKSDSGETVSRAPAAENGPSLRSKRETCKRINYTEPKDEECLVERRKGKPLYKVIDKSMSYTKQHLHTGRDRFPGRPKPKVLSNLVAKIRKRRKTELSVLSDEADNFMFPRTTREAPVEELDSKIEMLNHEMGAPPNGARPNRRKRNHVNDAEAAPKPVVPEIPNLTRIIHKEAVTRHKFAFERVPTTEPWYDAFLRQDEGREKVFEYYGSTAYRKLPFEMGPLPPLPANCCGLSAGGSKTAPTTAAEAKEEAKKKAEVLAKVSKRRRQMLDVEYPRKSPREHASTLAILSCLVQQRKKEESASESEKNGSGDEERRTKTASPKRVSRDYINVAQLNREIEELLSDPANESFESVDVSVLANDSMFVPLNTRPDFVSLLVEEEKTRPAEETSPASVMAVASAGGEMKGPKKRKNNRTGWPKKKSRGVRKSTNSDTVVNVKSEDLCVGASAVDATSPASEIFTVSSSAESVQSEADAKAVAKDSDTLSISAKSCFISDDPEEVNGTTSPSDAAKEEEDERRNRRKAFYQPVIALNRLETQLVYNSYSLRSTAAPKEAKCSAKRRIKRSSRRTKKGTCR